MDKTYPTLELVVRLYEHYEFMYITATTQGEHAAGSYHYKDEAIDIGCGLRGITAKLLKSEKGTRYGQMNALAAFLYERSSLLTELVHTKPVNPMAGWYVKYGHRQTWRFYGLSTALAHRNHVHVAVASEAAAQKLLTIVAQAALGLTQDGDHGPKTVAAIKAVQKSAGIAEDGIIGAHTVTAIRKHKGWVAA